MAKQPHGRGLRKGRVSIPGQIYIVTAVTHQRQPLFCDFCLGRIVVNTLRYQAEKCHVESFAYVVMPDHLHWLISLGETRSLSQVVGSVKWYSALGINRYLKRTGTPVWQRGFHDHALRREESIQTVARYIVGNPLRAGLVQRIGEYPLWDAVWL